MSFTVYGLRERGSIELRYIGFTKWLEQRMVNHLTRARSEQNPSAFSDWLDASIEPVALSEWETEAEARAEERRMIALFATLGHRLFNRRSMTPEVRGILVARAA